MCYLAEGARYVIPSWTHLIVLSDPLDLRYGREAKVLCKKVVAFFSLLSKTQNQGVRRLGVTQDLLTLVTSLAHYLKLLIRISLHGALKLERETHNAEGLHVFLDELARLESVKDLDSLLDYSDGNVGLAAEESDLCYHCQQPVDDECLKVGARRWQFKHLQCNHCGQDIGDQLGVHDATWSEIEKKAWCPQCSMNNLQAADAAVGIERITRLQQYVYLLRVALARLLSVLRSGGALPHTSGLVHHSLDGLRSFNSI